MPQLICTGGKIVSRYVCFAKHVCNARKSKTLNLVWLVFLVNAGSDCLVIYYYKYCQVCILWFLQFNIKISELLYFHSFISCSDSMQLHLGLITPTAVSSKLNICALYCCFQKIFRSISTSRLLGQKFVVPRRNLQKQITSNSWQVHTHRLRKLFSNSLGINNQFCPTSPAQAGLEMIITIL